MQRDDVIREQAEAIKEKIGPTLGYLNRLKDRTNQIFKLNVSIHYLSCRKTGMGGGHPASSAFASAEPLLSREPHCQPQHHGNQRRGD